MTEPRDNPLSSNPAFACNVYSMVPYIGVLFLPIAFVIGGRGYVKALRTGNTKDSRFCVGSLALTLFLTVIQLFLWSLLYIVPTLGL